MAALCPSVVLLRPQNKFHLPVKIKIYKTIILPVVLYRCETWSLILRQKHRLKVFENRVLRRISGPTRDEIIAGWRNCTMRNFITCILHEI
jgi:hypothetical protein